MGEARELDGDLLRRLYCEEMKTINQIAGILHIRNTTLREQMVKHGIHIRTRVEALILTAQRKGNPGEISADVLRKEYVERSRTVEQIAQMLGVKCHIVRYHMRKAGIQGRSKTETMRRRWTNSQFRHRMTRDRCHLWRGGRVMSRGYVLVYLPDHPDADVRGYVPQHRLVMESMVGRRLRPEEIVHHKNHARTDNRPENLELFSSNLEHVRHHGLERRMNRIAGLDFLNLFTAWLNRSCAWRLA